MDFVAPLGDILRPLGLDLYDVELTAGTLAVTVSRPGGVDLDALAGASNAISAWLDEADPIPGHFTLDVSSPGLERKLRTSEHFAGARGETVTLREHRDGEPTRRLQGEVLAADESAVTVRDDSLGEVRVPYGAIERARTVFLWGPSPKPSPSKGKAAATTSKKG